MYLVKSESWGKAITTAIKDAGATERKNSVVLLDGFYGASKEWFIGKSLEEIVDYFKDCLAFHEREYGTVLNAVIHFDEATPHLQVASIPLVNDSSGCRLSAKDIMGNRADYRKRQDRFFEQVGRPRGMERGEIQDPEATKEHLSVQAYKKQTMEQANQELNQQTQQLYTQYQRLLFQNQKLQELNTTIWEQMEQPYIQYCMQEFIRRAKVRGEHGEVKHVCDGFNHFMEMNAKQLQADWNAQYAEQSVLPEFDFSNNESEELDFDNDEYEHELGF